MQGFRKNERQLRSALQNEADGLFQANARGTDHPKSRQTFGSNLGVSHYSMVVARSTAPKSSRAATASSQRRPSLSRDVRLHLSTKKETAWTANRGPARLQTFLDRQKARRHFRCCSHPMGTQMVTSHLEQTSPHCLARKAAPRAASKSLRSLHRRDRSLASTCGTLPLFRISNTWLTAAGCAYNANTAAPGTGSLSPAPKELPSLVTDIDNRVTLVSGTKPQLLESTCPPPGGSQFPAVI